MVSLVTMKTESHLLSRFAEGTWTLQPPWPPPSETGGVMEMDQGILDRQYYDEAFLTKIGGAAADLLGEGTGQRLRDDSAS